MQIIFHYFKRNKIIFNSLILTNKLLSGKILNNFDHNIADI